MTALNVVCLADAVHLISDGAVIDPRGNIAHLMHKVTPLPHSNAVVGVRGVQGVANVLVEAISCRASSYYELRYGIADIVQSAFEPVASIWEKRFGPNILNCEIVVAGWSETSGPSAFILATSDTNAAHGLPAWKVVDISGTFYSPSDAALTADFARLQLNFNDASAIDLVSRQRMMPGRGVGGFAQLTTVRETGIETRILKRWPDMVGQSIALATKVA